LAITKLESGLIRSFILQQQTKEVTSISIEGTVMHFKSSVALLLKYFHNQYKVKKKDPKIGKGRFLHQLLIDFAYQQRALLRYRDIDRADFDKSLFPALAHFKRIMKDFVDTDVTTQSDSIIALLIYTAVREYEVANDLKVDDYLDDEFFTEEEEAKLTGKEGYIITPDHVGKPAPVIKHVHPSVDELYEES
jgi:hypothetical protein